VNGCRRGYCGRENAGSWFTHKCSASLRRRSPRVETLKAYGHRFGDVTFVVTSSERSVAASVVEDCPRAAISGAAHHGPPSTCRKGRMPERGGRVCKIEVDVGDQ